MLEIEPLDDFRARAAGDGSAVGAEAFLSATFSVRGSAGAAVEVTALAELSGHLLSIGIVNDYSASMLDQDLDVVARIQTDLFDVLPPIYEAEVTYFSTEVSVCQPFTTDRAALLDAVARDDTYRRQSTALPLL